ncbi:MAG: AAA family ATPase [Chloroflexi bacterium]|nr:AAA family ATPase [Chloroflexota bacterium]
MNQYQQFRQRLQAELGVDVSPETAALAEQIRQGDKVTRRQGDQARTEPAEAVTERESPVTLSPPHLVTLSSPFIAGPPITHPAPFFGREREVKRLFNLLRQRPLQNAAIIGPRRSGKTSLLHYLKNITTAPPAQLRPGQQHDWLPQPQTYRWIFVDFQDPRLGDRSGLLRYLLTQMELPAPDPCDLEQFLDIVSDGLTRPTVILFDEIGVALERYPQLDDAFWESLRFLATNQVQGNLAFILSSPEPPDRLAQHSGLGSPFFNIFGYAATLGPLQEAEARTLIASSPIPFAPADVEWILQESGRWPFLLQILCRERLLALEEGERGDDWKEDGRLQIAPFVMRDA